MDLAQLSMLVNRNELFIVICKLYLQSHSTLFYIYYIFMISLQEKDQFVINI